MTPASAAPLSRWVTVHDLPADGLHVTIEATPEERQALAMAFGLVALNSLIGSFRLSGSQQRVEVKGAVEAEIDQTCVVTLEPFTTRVREEVEVEYAAPGTPAPHGEDAPDEIVGGRIDLGALTAEFLSLGLDPYPRKPGVDFAYQAPDAERDTPFAALGKLRGDK
ncbi:MAG TPA: DUF177 domain-containing protein [Beijerinckiaceae bacterium]